MKRYRPYCAGYIVLYILILIAVVDAVHTLYGQLTGTINEMMASFSFFSYLIAAMGLCFGWLYIRAQVCIDEKNLRIAFPACIRPPEGAPRAMIVYRQGPNDLKLIDKTFPLASIERYGYVEDLGYSPVDTSGAGEKSPLFPVHEVCFLTSDNKRYHMNAAIYSKSQRSDMFTRIQKATGIAPEGKLKNEIAG